MPTIFDTAKYFLETLGQMTTMKLQKLCYYAQAWTLAWNETELFPEDFEAWTEGPVCQKLFQTHKGDYVINKDSLPEGDTKAFSETQLKNLERVRKQYGNKDAKTLSDQTHSEDPWKSARIGLSENERGNIVITKDSMRLYYGNFLPDEEAKIISDRIMAKFEKCYRALAQ